MPSLDATPADHTASHALLGLPDPTPRGSEPEMTPSVDPLNELASFLKWKTDTVPCEAGKTDLPPRDLSI